MFYTIQNNSILTAENEKALSRFYNNVKKLPDDYEVNKYVVENGELVLNPDWEQVDLENKKNSVRGVRNSYLETFVDPKQLVMVWNSLTAEEQELYKDYRQYLLDYPQTEGWWEENPMDFEEWKASQAVLEEME